MTKTTLFFLTAILGLASPAVGFQILSPVTEPCHEKILLGSLGDSSGFPITGMASVASLRQLLIDKINAIGVPNDKGTRGMMHEMRERFYWQDLSDAEVWMLSSFVAGIRSPDTSGFSVVDLNELRSIHIADSEQSLHSLRRSSDDYDNGDSLAIAAARQKVLSLSTEILQKWSSGAFLHQERWNFAFYGPQPVQTLAAAYNLGLISHVLQDAYSHTLRDDNMKIVAITNYVDAVSGRLNPTMDGPAHSQRMDQCNYGSNDFDQMRIKEAAAREVDVLNALDALMRANSTDPSSLNSELDQIYDYRSGCGPENSYCDSSWYPISQSSVTEPFLGGCGTLARNDFSAGPPSPPKGNLMILGLMMLLPFVTAIRLKKRKAASSL